jgi:hypothetical protein
MDIGQQENIGVGGQYVGVNISILVSAKILDGKINRYRLDPYRSNPKTSPLI